MSEQEFIPKRIAQINNELSIIGDASNILAADFQTKEAYLDKLNEKHMLLKISSLQNNKRH